MEGNYVTKKIRSACDVSIDKRSTIECPKLPHQGDHYRRAFAAGGPTDTLARLIGVPMSKTLKQQVVVENVVGAGGTIAANRVAKASPDGYTLLLHHIGHSTAPALYRNLPYDAIKDFEPIGLVNEVPMTLVAKKDFPPKDLKELISYVKANKDKINLANAGVGAASHLCGMLFMSAIQTEL